MRDIRNKGGGNLTDIKNFKELGEYLKISRENAEISLEQVQKQTKIRIKYLKAIENGDFSVIPGGEVYIKGFLKNYADSIGLNPDNILEHYKNIRGEHKKEPNLVMPSAVQKPSKIKTFITNHSLKIVGISILVVSFIVLSLFLRDLSAKKSFEKVKPPIIEDLPADEVNEEPVEGYSTIEEDTEVALEIVEDSKIKTVYVIDDDYIEIEIEVTNDRCWISVDKDSSFDFEGILKAGDTKMWRAEEKVNLRIGNPRVINLVINGKNLGSLTGEARDFIFERRAF